MVAVAPFAIVLGVVAAVALAVYGTWERMTALLEGVADSFSIDLERADIRLSREGVAAILAMSAAVLWLVGVIAIRPDPLRAALGLPVTFALSIFGFRFWLRRRLAARLKAFDEQLELALRLISSGLRAGLGLRQALVTVTDEMPDPTRSEFARVVARTNVGVTLDDALAMLVKRVPSDELRMMCDAIRVQSQSGGNLGQILDHLAATIKARRQIGRKVLSLTGEARMSAWVISLLPIGVGAFIAATQPEMRNALVGTPIGHASLIAFAVLELVGIVAVRRAMRFDV